MTSISSRPAPHGIIIAAGWGVLYLLLAGFVLGRGYNHDEEQFLAAARLTMDGAIYRDFIHLQPPYYVELLGALYQLLGLERGFFLTARLVNLLSTLAACLALWRHARGEPVAGFAGIGLFVCCTAIQPGIDSMRNDMMPCALALWAVALLVRELERDKARAGLIVLSGLLMAVAIGMKLSYGFVPLAALAYLAWCRRSALPALCLGGLVGAVPLLLFASPAWDGFQAGVLEYHRATPALWHTEASLTHYFSLEYLAEFLNRRVLTDATFATLLLLAVILAAGRRLPMVSRGLSQGRMGLHLLLIGGALLFGLLPRPPYIQYFQPFAAFIILSLAPCWRALSEVPHWRRALFTGLVALGCLPGGLVLATTVPRLVQPQKWMVNRIAATGDAIRLAMQERRLQGPVATLSPIPVLEAGLAIYPELAAGPFFYRTGDRLPPERLRELRGTSRATLPALLAATPPAAILVGREEAALEQPLIDHALMHGYAEHSLPGVKGFRLFLAPERLNPPGSS